MPLSLTKTIQLLLLITIACTPLFALKEVLITFDIAVPRYTTYFNLAKDLLLGLTTCLCILHLFRTQCYPATVLPFFIGFVVFTLIAIALSFHDLFMIIGGLRWALPFFLLFLLVGHIDRPFLERMVYVVTFVLLVNTAVQLYQQLTHQFRWGPSMYANIIGRVSGFFELPSIASLFGCLAFILIRYFFKGPSWQKRLFLIISIINVFLLSLSTTGFLLMLLFLIVPFVYRPMKHRMLYGLLAIALSIFVYWKLDFLNGRFPGDSSVSWNYRVGLMQKEWAKAAWFSSHFGGATNATAILKGMLGQPVSGDDQVAGGESLYPPLLGNYGIVFFILVMITLLVLLYKVLQKRNEPLFIFFLLAVLSGLTVRITECFPIGILVAILGAHFIQYYAGTKQPFHQ